MSSEIMMIANGFACRPGPATRIPKRHLETLFNAFIHPTRVSITYTSARDPEPRTKIVEPHGVIVGTRHYLVARDAAGDQRFKQYRLDRIIDMRDTVDIFERDPDFDIETYSARAFGSFFSDAEHTLVRWRFDPRAAPHQRRQVCLALDAAVMPEVPRQRGAAVAARTGLQSGHLPMLNELPKASCHPQPSSASVMRVTAIEAQTERNRQNRSVRQAEKSCSRARTLRIAT
ncbi:MAG: WYL domain-containing protein [Roseovarius sp.]|nr:WYL domain-containing protein [Roseovarius sp.]